MLKYILVLSILSMAYGQDPANSWLTYAVYNAPSNSTVTKVSTSWPFLVHGRL